MSNNFNTVKTEVIRWRNFSYNGTVYDLSHLDAHWVEYLDDRDEKNLITYRFIVTYGSHCFTKESDEFSSEELELLMYKAPRESRPFHFERYNLSKHLPSIIKSLCDKATLVCHGGHKSYAAVKMLDSKGTLVDYFVSFKVFPESKKLRLHVMSAYPKYEGIGKVQKVSFLVIAKNLLNNKKLPTP
ncbi:heat shock protein C [Calothrix sp. NIES-2100]|uniref:heat-shock protein n=1 Tax=Calothrix sp. NIES-2100 TaxID=1954172 RepID=UPI000B613758|nr:heat shock protein C [Calothrix sp. NIES-2100]